MWIFSGIGAVFAILTASTLIFRHRHLRFTAMVTFLFGLGILIAALAGPFYVLASMGDTSGVADVAYAEMRWGAFRTCFNEGGLGALIPLLVGAIGLMVARVSRMRSEPPKSIPHDMPPPPP
jgi:hypothetical protein